MDLRTGISMRSEGHVSLWRAGASVHLLAPWAGPSVPRTVPGIQTTLRRCLLNELLSLNFLKKYQCPQQHAIALSLFCLMDDVPHSTPHLLLGGLATCQSRL